jgi:hypothetical protein
VLENKAVRKVIGRVMVMVVVMVVVWYLTLFLVGRFMCIIDGESESNRSVNTLLPVTPKSSVRRRERQDNKDRL